MDTRYKYLEIASLFVFLLIICGCTKMDDSERFAPYLGEWQFRVYRTSWGPPLFNTSHDTMRFSGSIMLNESCRGVVINYSEDVSVLVWIEDSIIFRNASKLGSIDNVLAQFRYTIGTMYSGSTDEVYGTRKQSDPAAYKAFTINRMSNK